MKIKPMLAVSADLNTVNLPVYASWKFDGIRALVIDGVVMSRSLKPIRNKYVQKLFGKSEYNGLDGELIVGDYQALDVFQETTKGVMRTEGNPDVKFYVFDVWDKPELEYSERLKLLTKVSDNNIRIVDTTLVADRTKLLDMILNVSELQGEGLILRSPDSGYKYGRSTLKQGWLLKVKFFEDAEFEVLDMEEMYQNNNDRVVNELGRSSRSTHKENLEPLGTMGSLILKYDDDLTFKCGTGFTLEQRQHIWDNRDDFIGQKAKVRYMTAGMKDLPRCPSFQGFRDSDDL